MTQRNDQVTANVQVGGMINYIPCSVEVGEVTTLPAGSDATVTNSGDEHEIILDFGIPKGDKGDTGDTGATGKSAYESAVDGGYTGTEAEFETSLAGIDTAATAAAASATAAAASATAASGSATTASTAATTATTKAGEAATSAANAATSASSAGSHATSAQNYVTQAATYASNAANSATNAATYASNAASSASNAASMASSASTSASTVQSAASTATEKANAASQSATAAAGSATSAGTSADNAAASALAASTSATAAQDALAEVQSYRRIDRTYIAGTAIDDYTGSLTVFDLGLDFDLADYVVDVFVNGKGYQGVKAPVDFTISGDVVTFVEAVPVGAVVQFRINASTTVIIAGSVDVDAKIAEHNTNTTAHSDIRTALTTHTGNANIHVTSSDKSNWNAKQAALSTDQIAATNSGVTAAKVSSYDTHVADTDIHVTVSDKSTWNGKQSALSTAQLSATNSGITSAKVSAYDSHIANNDIHVTAAKVSGYDTHVANGDIHVTATQKTAWTGKQDTISDLSTIRSGAAAGATAVQPADLQTAINSVKRNIGEIVPSMIPLTDAGLHLLDGSVISGSGSYSAFVTYIAGLVSDYPGLFETEANWQTSVTTYGVCGKFVYDSTNNTVRLPKITGIIEGTTDATALGDLVEAGLPNITGELTTNVARENFSGSGAISYSSSTNYSYANYSSSGAGRIGTLSFDAGNSNSAYGNSSTVQPQTIKGFYYIVVANSTKTEIEVDVDEIAADLNGKADVDLTNCTRPHIVETYHNGSSWYRVWSDGWCEQGGYVDNGVGSVASGSQVTFLKAFADTNYTITFLSGHSDTSTNTVAVQYGNYYYGCYYPSSKATTGIMLRGHGTWKAEGYIA